MFVAEVTLEGGVTEVRRPAIKCNGMTFDADLNLLVCEHVTSCLMRESPDGEREIIAFKFEGHELNSRTTSSSTRAARSTSPTPGTGACPASAIHRERELGFQGVYRVPPSGGDLRLVVGQNEFEMPNGLCFSPDESLLYINDTPGAYIKVWDACRRNDLEWPDVLRGHRLRRHRGRHSGRDEVRRAGEHLGDWTGRDLGALALRGSTSA